MIHLLPSLNNNLKQQTQPCKSPQESLTYQNPGKDKERKKERKKENHQIHKRFPMGSKKKVPFNLQQISAYAYRKHQELRENWRILESLFANFSINGGTLTNRSDLDEKN
jgi:hypothetical protein